MMVGYSRIQFLLWWDIQVQVLYDARILKYGFGEWYKNLISVYTACFFNVI